MPCGECHLKPGERCNICGRRRETDRPKGSDANEWQLFLVDHKHDLAFLAVQIAEAIEAERDAIRKENEQLQARLHCMCGSPMDHSAWEGHSPVSMYDHALDEANAKSERLQSSLMWVFDRLSVAVGRGAEGMTIKEQRDTHREIGYALMGRESRSTKH